MRKIAFLLFIIGSLSAVTKDALIITTDGHVFNKKNCTLTLSNGDVFQIEKIEIVDSFEDLRIELVTSFPDIQLKKSSESEYTINEYNCNCGDIEIVENGGDIKVKIVDDFADVTVEISE